MKLERLLAALLCLLLLCACGTNTAAPAETESPKVPVAPPDDLPKTSATGDAPTPPPDAAALPARTWPLTVTEPLASPALIQTAVYGVASTSSTFSRSTFNH